LKCSANKHLKAVTRDRDQILDCLSSRMNEGMTAQKQEYDRK
jgi:hypothetical protein